MPQIWKPVLSTVLIPNDAAANWASSRDWHRASPCLCIEIVKGCKSTGPPLGGTTSSFFGTQYDTGRFEEGNPIKSLVKTITIQQGTLKPYHQ